MGESILEKQYREQTGQYSRSGQYYSVEYVKWLEAQIENHRPTLNKEPTWRKPDPPRAEDCVVIGCQKGGPMMKDRFGNTIRIGDRFRYQVNTPHESTGRVIRKGHGVFIRWDDNAEDIRLKDFWYAPSDENITELATPRLKAEQEAKERAEREEWKKIERERDEAIEKARQEALMELVFEERENQDIKWGEQNHDPFAWLAILGEEVGEANKAALEARFGNEERYLEDYKQELIQVAAVAVAMVESLERKKWAWPSSNNPLQPTVS